MGVSPTPHLSQSPLVGAFVPALVVILCTVAIHFGRNPLWSGHSFRLEYQALAILDDKESQSPLVGGSRSGPQVDTGGVMRALGRNPLWSGHSFRLNFSSTNIHGFEASQSPLVGAFVPAIFPKNHSISC